MAVLKKLISRQDQETIFPQQKTAKLLSSQSSTDSTMEDIQEKLLQKLLNDEIYINRLENRVTQKLLEILSQKYDFMPTDKYQEEVKNKKKYISQLDSYLQERRDINNTIENELQMFLQETTANLSKAMDSFTLSIQSRIKQAETRHGIGSIKDILMSSIESVKVPE